MTAYVMNNVEMGNIVEEETALPPKDWTVDGRGGTTLEVPFIFAVMRRHRISVVKVGDEND
jgi:hypothetical protein